jgi:signal transduction histidine kinase
MRAERRWHRRPGRGAAWLPGTLRRSASALRVVQVLLSSIVFAAAAVAAAAVAADAAPVIEIRQAQRSGPGVAIGPVTLPDEIEAEAADAVVRATYRTEVDLGPAPTRLALYASGVIGSLRVTLNGAVLRDEITEPLAPAPRGLGRLRFVELPDALLQPGRNRIELELAGRGGASLSVLRAGDRDALVALRDRKAVAMVIGPAIVATVVGCLGASMLVLFMRWRSERIYGYFGGGALLWSLHTFWTVAPQRVLPGVHLVVWWTTLYVALVVLLVLFCLHFAQRARPRVEKLLLAAIPATPPLLYAAASLKLLGPATDAVRLALIVAVLLALGAVAHHAWHRRRVDSALLVLAGLAGAGFGLRDWLVFRSGADNLPVQWVPYAGLPFVALVSALLIERFVRTTEKLERLNGELDRQVARREAELAANYERLARLEREQAAAEERQRLQRELHDGLGAKLVTALARVESAGLDAEGLARELRACLADMRLASEAFAPEATDLGAVIGNFLFRWESVLRDAGVQPRWRVELPAQGLPVSPYVALQLLRVMQEALSNALRHADARNVTLALARDGAVLALVVEDDGRGLPPSGPGPGRGLADMRIRAGAIGAQFALGAPPGGGTRVELRWPLPA